MVVALMILVSSLSPNPSFFFSSGTSINLDQGLTICVEGP